MKKIIVIVLLSVSLLLPPNSMAEHTSPCSRVSGLLKIAEDLRSLQSTGPIECIELEHDAYRARANQLTEIGGDSTNLQHQEIAYKMLGIIPVSYPYAYCIAEMSGEFSEALYDRRKKQIVLRKDTPISDSILIHEIVHALQDQHFDLEKLRGTNLTSDLHLALSALIEGDAIVREIAAEDLIDQTDQKDSVDSETSLQKCRPPEPLYSILMFPYEWGRRFVSILEKNYGLLDQSFLSPPLTSREIIYPEEFVEHQGSPPFGQPEFYKGRPANYQLLYSDVLGEYSIRSLFRTFSGRTFAIRAGRGWLGDLLELYQLAGSSDYMLRWQVHLESEVDVQQFLEALVKYTASHFRVTLAPEAKQWSIGTPTCEGFEVRSDDKMVIMTYFFSSSD